MKKILLIIIVALVGVGIWLSQGDNTQEITTEIEISAPPEKVWNVLTNFNQWPTWNTTVTKTYGDSTLGSKLTITMRDYDGKDANKYQPVITVFDKPSTLKWRAKMMAEFLFTNEKIVELKKTTYGTQLIHKETFSGLLVKLFWGKMEDGVPPILNAMNKALKVESEKK